MDGVALASRFSIATNRLAYCGPSEAAPALYEAILADRGTETARTMLQGFEALWPYLEAIGSKHGLDPLDRGVVEAYWLGNELLDAFERKDFPPILEALRRRGLPRADVDRLIANLPSSPIPHHMFHVAFVGVGAVTGHVPTTLANVEACRPSWGQIERIDAETLSIARPSLEVHEGRLAWSVGRLEEVRYERRVLPTAATGASVVLHWHWPALLPTEPELQRLRSYSERSLAAANEVLPVMGVFAE